MLSILKTKYKETKKEIKKLEEEVENLKDNVKELENKLKINLSSEKAITSQNYSERQIVSLKEILEIVKNTENKVEQLKSNLSAPTSHGLEKQVHGLVIRGLRGGDSRIDKKLSQLAIELHEYHDKLEKEIEKRNELENKVKKLKNPSLEKSENLLKEIARLNELLKKANENIKRWEMKIKELEEELIKHHQALRSDIDEKKIELEQKKKDYIKEISENKSFFNSVKTSLKKGKWEDYPKRLEKLLNAQERAVKYKESEFEAKKNKLKKELIESTPEKPEELVSKLKNLCKLQKKLTQLEIELKDTERVANVFKIKVINQGIYSGGNVDVKGDFILEDATINYGEQKASIEIPPKK